MTDRPLDPADLLAQGIASTSGCSIDTARAEALPLLDFLTDAGAFIAYEVSLPGSAPKGDPVTAAESIDDLSDRQWAVWWMLSYHGPLTDEGLADRYEQYCTSPVTRHAAAQILPPQTPQSIRSRRAELVRAGHVEPVLGEDGKQIRRPTSNRGTAGVWRASSGASTSAELRGAAA